MSDLHTLSADNSSSVPGRRISRLAIASLLCGAAMSGVGLVILSDARCDFSDLLTLTFPLFFVAAIVLCIWAHRAIGKAADRLGGTRIAKAGAIVAGVTLLGVMFLVPPIWFVQYGAARSESQNNLKQITRAMYSYAEERDNRLPPAALSDKDGQPLLSWRVLLLPYLGEGELYAAFHLDEPWDSPHNRALLTRMPKVYKTPRLAKANHPPNTTFYQVLTGRDTAFESAEGPRWPKDFEKTSGTILIAEAGEAVPWTKPQDIVYDPDKPLPKLGGLFSGPSRFRVLPTGRAKIVNVALADGSTRYFFPSMSEHAWRWAISRTTRERQPPEW